MDILDSKALNILQQEGRASWTRIASALNMTPPAAAERVRRLEEAGVIRGYAALLDPQMVGAAMTAFIAVTLDRPIHRKVFLKRVAQVPEIVECHHTAGDDDFLLKVRCGGTTDLERILTSSIKSLAGVARTRTVIVLRTEKETVQVPLGALE